MGHCLALGALPSPLLCKRLRAVLGGLVGVASTIEGCEPQYTESRRDAVRAISRYSTSYTLLFSSFRSSLFPVYAELWVWAKED